MRGVIFFTYLCLLLLGGYGSAYTAIHHDPLSHGIGKTQTVTFTHTRQDYTIIEDNSLTKEAQDIISEEAEDEDARSLFTRKYRSLSRTGLSFSCPFVLSYLHNRSKASQPFGSCLSSKYITLRVLRI